MGEVWGAVHADQQIPVAVKVLSGEHVKQPQYWQAFRNEVQAVAGLNHPGVVMVLDYGEVPRAGGGPLPAGSPYLVMEMASGGSLDQRAGSLPWHALKSTLLTLLDALAHAHARGVIHRDIKPANVLISLGADARPGLKLTDFGIAHALDQSREGSTDKLSGTPQYMAPEQFEGRWRDYGPWTDLYALGIMAWEMACGFIPFDGRTFVHQAWLHISNPLPDFQPVEILPTGFEDWLRRLLAKRPEDRFPCVADAAAALSLLDPHPDALDPRAHAPIYEILSPRADEPVPTLEVETILGLEDTCDSVDSGFFEGNTSPSLDTRGAGSFAGVAPPMPAARARVPYEGRRSTLARGWRRQTPPGPSMQLVGAGLGLYGLRAVPFVGREAERDLIWTGLTQAALERHTRLLILRGPAGVGKSRLVEWMCERAHELGVATILKATHAPVPGPVDGVAGMVARHLRCVGLSRADLCARVRVKLQGQGVTSDYEWQALAELLAPSPEPNAEEVRVTFNSAAERYVLVGRLIERLAAARPVILWLDDVQWGADALGLVDHLMGAAMAEGTPLLILLAARDEALAERPAERALLDALGARPAASWIDVAPMGTHDSGVLVRELLGLEGELADKLRDRCGGNPLFASQLVGDWVQRGVLKVGPGGFVLKPGDQAILPDDIHQIWTDRLDRLLKPLPDPARAVLELAAVLGREVDAQEWRQACAQIDAELLPELVEALFDHHLMKATDRGWCFAHGMIHESVERAAVDRGVAPPLHRAAAAALAQIHGPSTFNVAERIGRHLLLAGALDEAIDPLLRGAVHRRWLYQHKEELRLQELCLDALVRLGAPEHDPRWGRVWLEVALAQRRQMRLDEAEALAVRVEAEALRHGWAALLPEARWALGDIVRQRGDLTRAEALLTQARDSFEAMGQAPDLARAISSLAAVVFQQGDLHRAELLLDQGQALSRQVGDQRNVGRCLLLLGHVARRQSLPERATDLYQQAYASAETLGNRLGMAGILNSLGEIARYRGDLLAAEVHYRRAVALFDDLGHGEQVFPRINLGLLLLRRGEDGEARRALEAGLTFLERLGQRGVQGAVHVALIACAAARDDWEAWDTHAKRAATLLAASALVDPDIAWAARLAGVLARQAGQLDRARAAWRLSADQLAALGEVEKSKEVQGLIDSIRDRA